MIKKYFSKYTGQQIDEAVQALIENNIVWDDLSQELKDKIPLIIDEIWMLPVPHTSIVVGFENDINLDSLNKTPEKDEQFWGLCKTTDNYIYSVVAKYTGKIILSGNVKYAVFEFIGIQMIYNGNINITNGEGLGSIKSNNGYEVKASNSNGTSAGIQQMPSAVALGMSSMAFGGVRSDRWDEYLNGSKKLTTVLGDFSYAFGVGNYINNNFSFAGGKDNTLYQGGQTSFGGGNRVGFTEEEFNSFYTQTNSNGEKINTDGYTYKQSWGFNLVGGTLNTVRGLENIVGGLENNIFAYESIVSGDKNQVGVMGNMAYHNIVNGKNNVVKNSNTLQIGENNTADALDSINGGSGNVNYGNNNILVGKNSKVNAGGNTCANIFGEGLIANAPYQTVLGKYNSQNTSALLQIGYGASETSRSTVFEVLQNGRVVAKADAVNDNELPRLSQVKNLLSTKQNSNPFRLVADNNTVRSWKYLYAQYENKNYVEPIEFSSTTQAWSIPQREEQGQVTVGTPTKDSHATSKKYVDTKIADLVNSAPEALNTLKELADAINNHEDAYDSLLEVVGDKVNKNDLDAAIKKLEIPVIHIDVADFNTTISVPITEEQLNVLLQNKGNVVIELHNTSLDIFLTLTRSTINVSEYRGDGYHYDFIYTCTDFSSSRIRPFIYTIHLYGVNTSYHADGWITFMNKDKKVVKHINFNTEFCNSLEDNEFRYVESIVGTDVVRNEDYRGIEYNDNGQSDVLILDFNECSYGDLDMEYGYYISITGIKPNTKVFVRQWYYNSHIWLSLVTKNKYLGEHITREMNGSNVNGHLGSITRYGFDDSAGEMIYFFEPENDSPLDMLIEFEQFDVGNDNYLHVKMCDIALSEL